MDKDNLYKTIMKELETTESRIFSLEKIYLEETSGYGNMIKGWDSILNFKHHRQNTIMQSKKIKINDKDRLFSLSSVTSEVNALLKKDIEDQSNDLNSQNNINFIRKRNLKKGKSMMTNNRGYGKTINDLDDISEDKTRSPARKRSKVLRDSTKDLSMGNKNSTKVGRGLTKTKKIKKKNY